MLQFDALPSIPSSYSRLSAITPEEIATARRAGYIADTVDPAAPARRPGLDNSLDEPPEDHVRDWRTRVYVIWFCYVYENFLAIEMPAYSIEELILEFKAPSVLDTPSRRLGTLYAGAGADDPLSPSQHAREIERLQPH